MLGLERNHDSGEFGTGSSGYGRIWRYSHSDLRYEGMMIEAAELWKDIERKSGKELLPQQGLLVLKRPETQGF